MARYGWKLVVVGCALFLLGALSNSAKADERAGKEQIAKWVQQLSDNDYATRVRASERLWKAGRDAEAALQEALKSDDPEVIRRAGELLAKFKWGIYADTPPAVVERITRYRTSDPAGKVAVVKELFDMGGGGCTALVKIASAEENADLRKQLSQQINQETGRVIPTLLAEGRLAALDDLLELTVAGRTKPDNSGADAEAALRNYAVYWLLRGRIDEKIAHYKALVEKGSAPCISPGTRGNEREYKWGCGSVDLPLPGQGGFPECPLGSREGR